VVLTGSSTGLSASRRQLINESAVYAHSHDGNGFGAVLAVAKITGDAYADVVVGAPTERVSGKSGAGAAYVLHGSATGVDLARRQRFTAATPGVPGSASADAHFGAALFAHKLNGDAYADLVIGVPDKSSGASHGGMFVRLKGKSSGISTSGATAVGSHTAHDHLGASIR
jgi:hypothetical protein